MTDGGKGDKRRKAQITDEQLAANWEGINWNAREALPDLPSDQGSDSEATEEA